MIVLIDVDGVVADLVSAFLRELRGADGYADHKFTPDDVHEWNIGSALGLHVDVAGRAWDVLRRPGAHADIQPYTGAREAVDAIRATGAEVCFVTQPLGSAPTWCHDRSVWLQRHLGYNSAIYTKRKHLIDGDVLVDDNPEQLAAWIGQRRDRTNGYCGAAAFLIDRPWNRDAHVEGAIRVPDLAAVATWCTDRVQAERVPYG